MDFHHHYHYHTLGLEAIIAKAVADAIKPLEAKLSALADQLTAIKTAFDAAATAADNAITRSQQDHQAQAAQLATLQQQIADLQAQIANGTISPTDQATIDALVQQAAAVQAKLDALDPTNPAVVPTPTP